VNIKENKASLIAYLATLLSKVIKTGQ